MHKTFIAARPSALALAVLPAIAVAAPPAAPPLDAYGDLPAVEEIAISPSGEGLATVAQFKGERRLMVVDGSGALRANASVGDAKLRGLDWVGEDVVLVTNSATSSLGPMFTASKYEFRGTIIVPLNGEKSQLVFSRSRSIGTTTQGRYGIRNIDGTWKGYFGGIALDVSLGGETHWRHGRPTLYAPGREAKDLPVILLPHGGPSAHDEPVFDWWAQTFASRGYAVFQPNFRGSTNRSDAFRRAGYGQWGRKMQTDLSDGLAELARRGIADPKRACIVGASYGGYAALAGVTLQQGLYRCAVSVAGVADVELMYNTDVYESGNSKMTWKSLREALGDPKTYDAISPRRFAAKADAPVLLIHGKDDTVVPFKQSQVMADALKDAGKPYEMVVLKHEDHWLSRGETRKEMLSATMRFVQKYNPAD